MKNTLPNKNAKENFTVTRRSIVLEGKISVIQILIIVAIIPSRASPLITQERIGTPLSSDANVTFIVTRRSIVEERVTATKNPVKVMAIPLGVSMNIKIGHEGVPHPKIDEEQANQLAEVTIVTVTKINTKLTGTALNTMIDPTIKTTM